MREYPYLYDIIAEIANDNGMRLRRSPMWPEIDLYAVSDRKLKQLDLDLLALLEKTATNMTARERKDVAAADSVTQEKILERFDLAGKLLDNFLNEVFDGIYYENFYEP